MSSITIEFNVSSSNFTSEPSREISITSELPQQIPLVTYSKPLY
jgi:hypothetical protein